MSRGHLARGLPVVQREPHRDVLLVCHVAHYNGAHEGRGPFLGCGGRGCAGEEGEGLEVDIGVCRGRGGGYGGGTC